MNKYEYKVKGMHCAACELLIENKLSHIKGIVKVDATLKDSTIYVESNIELTPNIINSELEVHGYKILEDNASSSDISDNKDYFYALSISLVLIVIFFLFQKSGLINFANSETITLPFIFLIGIVASLSTCMAVVGGLVLSISTAASKQKNYKTLIVFHVSRLVGFFVLGGIMGVIGSAVSITPTLNFLITILLFSIMLSIGLNLLDLKIPHIEKFKFRIPKLVGQKIITLSDKRGYSISSLLGIATFILPCGFTQSMQFYALSKANFLDAGTIMLVFALGTMPVLAAMSFASAKLSRGIQAGLFYKTAGILILMFAVFNLLSGLVGLGVIPPFINF